MVPSGFNQSFGHLVWNCPAQSTNIYLETGFTVAGNFEVLGTGAYDPNTRALRMSNTSNGYTITVNENFMIENDASFKMNNGNGSCSINVGGNFNLSSGSFCIVSGAASSTLSVVGNVSINGGTLLMHEDASATLATLNVGGNFTFSNGTITESSSGKGLINFNKNGTQIYSKTGGVFSQEIDFRVNSGAILDMGSSIIDGSIGTFSLDAGAGIISAHPQGLSTNSGEGNFQLTGLKTFSVDANYTYNGTVAQVTGNGLTTANNLTINNNGGVTLTNNITINNSLNLTSGNLNTTQNKITINGNINPLSGYINASSNNSTIEFSGNTAQAIPTNTFYNNQVYNLLINNSNNVSLSGTLVLLNSISNSSGLLDASTNAPTVSYGGSILQSIESGNYLNNHIYNLTVDNSSGLGLNTDFTISNNLTINLGKKMTISPGKTLSISGSIINNAGSSGFILQSNNTGTASLIHNSNNIGATLQRYISGETEAWHFLSSPVSNQSISETWTPSGTYGNGTGYDLYVWHEPTFCWIYRLDNTSTINWNTVHPGAVFTPGRGYLYSFQEANPTKEFVGNLNNGTISCPVYFSATDLNLKGFNLIGNPYPSSIDWQSASGWSRSNLALSAGGFDMWIWNPTANNYGVFNSSTGVGTNGISRYIAPTQGFFVLAASSGNLVMDNNVRVQNTIDWFKHSNLQDQNISLTVESEDGYGADEVMIDFGYPANEKGTKKLFSNSSIAPSLYMGSKGNYQSVQYLTNIINTPKVPLIFNAGKSGFYKLRGKFDNNEFEILSLKDRKTNTVHNFKESNTYRFQALTTDDANRFELKFTADNNIDFAIPAKVFSFEKKLVIDLTLISEETELYVYDLVGRLVLQGKLTANSIHPIDFSICSQMVLIYLRNQSGSLKQKLVWTGN